MPLQQTSGNDTQDAYGGGAAAVPVYVENVFSTYLYTGTGATQSITNNIGLSTSGGLVWIKDRSNAYNNNLFDTTQGATKLTHSNTNAATVTDSNSLTSFNTTGFTLGSGNTSGNQVNTSSDNFVSWTFRKQPNFFDIVTYTGTGSYQTINHNLGSTPGCMIIKKTSSTGTWIVYFADNGSGWGGNSYYLSLNLSAAATNTGFPGVWGATDPTSTQFTVGTDTNVNASGQTYIAYLFGNGGTGGFGLSGTQDIIKCGYYTGNGSTSGPSITLGFEPQWVLTKAASRTGAWAISDVMRQMSQTNDAVLVPNASGGEAVLGAPLIIPSATGFKVSSTDQNYNSSGDTYMYIAIRRGPMAVPTDPTKVFAPVTASETPATVTGTTNFPVDMLISTYTNSTGNRSAFDRLRGTSSTNGVWLNTNTTAAEATASGAGIGIDSNVSFLDNGFLSGASGTGVYWSFKRAPSFFDEVCDTGDGTTLKAVAHNLTVVPQMMIRFERSAGNGHWVYTTTTGNTSYGLLNQNQAFSADPTSAAIWGNTTPTSSNFYVGYGTTNYSNQSGQTYVTYLFATLTGVSKVGSYTGTGGTQSIACGFGAGGARFILAKRTDAAGDWYCWDSANGLTSSSSPYLLWDTTAAQTTGNNGTYASSGGFTLTSASPVNTSGGSFIFLAIA